MHRTNVLEFRAVAVKGCRKRETPYSGMTGSDGVDYERVEIDETEKYLRVVLTRHGEQLLPTCSMNSFNQKPTVTAPNSFISIQD